MKRGSDQGNEGFCKWNDFYVVRLKKDSYEKDFIHNGNSDSSKSMQ